MVEEKNLYYKKNMLKCRPKTDATRPKTGTNALLVLTLRRCHGEH